LPINVDERVKVKLIIKMPTVRNKKERRISIAYIIALFDFYEDFYMTLFSLVGFISSAYRFWLLYFSCLEFQSYLILNIPNIKKQIKVIIIDIFNVLIRLPSIYRTFRSLISYLFTI